MSLFYVDGKRARGKIDGPKCRTGGPSKNFLRFLWDLLVAVEGSKRNPSQFIKEPPSKGVVYDAKSLLTAILNEMPSALLLYSFRTVPLA